MVRKNTWTLLIVFAVLLAATLFWQRAKISSPSVATATPTSLSTTRTSLFDFSGRTVQRIHIKSQGKDLILERNLDGKWVFITPKVGDADSALLESTMQQFLSLPIISSPELTASLEDIGLSPAVSTIVATLDDGKQVTVNVGKATTTGTGYYVLTNDRTIYIVSKFGLDSILGMVDQLPILPTPTPTPEPSPTPENVTETPEVTSTP